MPDCAPRARPAGVPTSRMRKPSDSETTLSGQTLAVSPIDWITGHELHRDHCLGSVERRAEVDGAGADLVAQASQFGFKLRKALRHHRMQPMETGGPLDAAHRDLQQFRGFGLRSRKALPVLSLALALPSPIRTLAISIRSM